MAQICKYKSRFLNPNSVKCCLYRSQSANIKLQNICNANEGNDKNIKNEPVEDTNCRINDFNIQMLSKTLYTQLFGEENVSSRNQHAIDSALLELKKHGLPGPLHKVADVDLKLPPLYNNNIEDHFHMIGEQQCAPYRTLINKLIGTIPKIPESWSFASGWTKYVKGEKPISVEYPNEDAIVFDVEVCCTEGSGPTMATAVSSTAWYSWVSKELMDGNSHIGRRKYTTNDLIPLETNSKVCGSNLSDDCLKPKIVVGHCVSYDRARLKEQYWLERTGLRFMDTMALHVCISGVTSYQKMLLKSESSDEDWSKVTSLNSLNEVHKLYCGTSIAKELRDTFVTGTYKDVINKFQSLMTYCAKDVIATHEIFIHLWPIYLERFPHPVTLAGMLELSTAYLPVNNNWNRYIEDSNQSFSDFETETKVLLTQQADKACQLLHNEQYKRDLWLWSEDWKIKELKLLKEKRKMKRDTNQDKKTEVCEEEIDEYEVNKYEKIKKFSALIASTERLPKKIPYLAGYPEWYREQCISPTSSEWKPGPQLITTTKRIAPKLLRMSWKLMPLHYVRNYGWGQLVPYMTEIPLPDDEVNLVPMKELTSHYRAVYEDKTGSETNINLTSHDLKDRIERLTICKKSKIPNKKKSNILDNIDLGCSCGLIKLPHKDGSHLNVGNPLSKDFVATFTNDMCLNCSDVNASRIIEISHKMSYWKNNHERIESQLIVWLLKKDLPYSLKQAGDYGAILPQVLVCGTLTRRATEQTWMTASNATGQRIGSELRCMIQSPKGYNIVGADVDSQELWISSLIGDAHFAKEHGCTAFGWMTISGDKSDGTDMHSMTAKTMGISRTNAKVINYARIYGAGQRFAERLLKQFIPDISPVQAAEKASKMFRTTKGKCAYVLKQGILPEMKQRIFSRYIAGEVCKLNGKNVDELFEKPQWIGGSESAMFNRLEEIACSSKPVTPFLGCRLSRALEPGSSQDDDKFIPTRINWVVQSGAVDFLHLMLVCMRWLVDHKVRFCLSFHDEVRYLVPEEKKYETALALHVTNLLTRAFCVQKLGMRDLPQSVAFFSSVEVDTVLRKDAFDDCKTPSNPHGLSKGYNIPLGESLDILKAIEKANSKIGIYGTSLKQQFDNGEHVIENKKEICSQ